MTGYLMIESVEIAIAVLCGVSTVWRGGSQLGKAFLIFESSVLLISIYNSRQDQFEKETWLEKKCTCPMCRSRFCIRDVSYIDRATN